MENSLYKELWTKEHDAEAQRQGWNLFNADGERQLQRIDEYGTFESDDKAWEHVVFEAQEGNMTAITALAILVKDSPKEIERIKKHVGLTN